VELARFISQWSKDPSTQTGAVIADSKRRIISVGYNGLAMGVDDTVKERLENRDIKYKVIVHCERNAIIFANRCLDGCTLFTWPFMSCATCAAMVIQAGIKRCVAPYNDAPRWQEDFKLATQMFKEAGVLVELLDPALFVQ
jgi:dCMP deaminase